MFSIVDKNQFWLVCTSWEHQCAFVRQIAIRLCAIVERLHSGGFNTFLNALFSDLLDEYTHKFHLLNGVTLKLWFTRVEFRLPLSCIMSIPHAMPDLFPYALFHCSHVEDRVSPAQVAKSMLQHTLANGTTGDPAAVADIALITLLG